MSSLKQAITEVQRMRDFPNLLRREIVEEACKNALSVLYRQEAEIDTLGKRVAALEHKLNMLQEPP